MSEREWTLTLWRLMIEFVRAFGKKNNLCADIKIIKQGTERKITELED